MAKADMYHLVYRKYGESGTESIETFAGSKDAVKLMVEEIEKDRNVNEDGDDVIGIFQGKKIKYSAEVKVEVTLN